MTTTDSKRKLIIASTYTFLSDWSSSVFSNFFHVKVLLESTIEEIVIPRRDRRVASRLRCKKYNLPLNSCRFGIGGVEVFCAASDVV